MAPHRWLSVPLLALAVVAGAAWWLQRQGAAQLRDEIALLRDEHRQIDALRAANARLAAAQPPAAEIDRLRADRAAVGQLRAEIEKLKTGVDERERALQAPAVAVAPPVRKEAKAPIPVLQVLPVASWKDAGEATPTAAFETMLWAGSTRNVGALSNALVLDPEAGALAQKQFEAASPAQQQEYGTPLRMLAALMAKNMPTGDVSVVNVKALDPNSISVVIDALLKDRDGSASKGKFEFVRSEGRWLLKLPAGAVEHLTER